jgi:hypothetical protein
MCFRCLLCVFGHKFLEWEYINDKSCEQIRTCIRCGYEQKRTQHEFSEWEYISDEHCKQGRICMRCGVKETRQASHKFGDWRNGKRICLRCGEEEHCSHNWKWVPVNDDYHREQCTNCKLKKHKEHHSYGPSEWINPNSSDRWQDQTCSICGHSRLC